MPTIGQKLEETRLSRGLSIEDVAHETRIHPNMLLRIEEDDFSHFPSVAYAKSFVRKYGHHLGLDLGDAMESLDVGVTRIGENELMGEMKRTIHKDRLFHLERTRRLFRRRRPAKRGSPLFLNVVLATLMAALGLFYFLGYNAPSAQKATEEITRGIARGMGIDLPPAPGVASRDANPALPADTGSPLPADRVVRDTGDSTPAPVYPGTPPVYPPIKEAIDLTFKDDLPAQATGAGPATASPATPQGSLPRPRETPRLVLSENPVPPPDSAPPANRTPKAEPQPVLRPVGTNPPAPTARETRDSSPGGEEETPAAAGGQGSGPEEKRPSPGPASSGGTAPVNGVR